MDFKKCEALLAAIDTGSFTKAAEQLHYTPSGISHMMTNLEAELGFPLLYRSKTGVVPTPSALELMPVLREMADCANRFEQISSRINGVQTGRLTIGVYTSIATCWLPPVIKAFAASYPGIRIILKEGIHQELDSFLALAGLEIAQDDVELVDKYSYLGYMTGNDAPVSADYNWIQSHDVDANMTSAPDGGNVFFTQIGSMYDAKSSANVVDADASISYFNGVYNGNTYSIKNLSLIHI